MEDFEQKNTREEQKKEERKNVSEQQSQVYAEALTRLMERSHDNPKLAKAITDFIEEINLKSWEGEADKPFEEDYIERMTRFFEQKTRELKQLI